MYYKISMKNTTESAITNFCKNPILKINDLWFLITTFYCLNN